MTYLVVVCPTCHAIYKVQRVHTPAGASNDGCFYCLCCGKLGATITQLDPTAHWLEVMAQYYNVSTEEMAQLSTIYDGLLKQGSHITLHQMITGEKPT